MSWLASQRTGRGLLLGLTLTLAGCFWPSPGGNGGRRAYNVFEDTIGVDTASSLTQLWAAQLDSGPAGDPVTSLAGVHAVDDQSAYGLAFSTGERVWEHEVAAPLEMGEPHASGDQVMVSRWNPSATYEDDPSVSDAFAVLDASTGAVETESDEGMRYRQSGPLAADVDQSIVKLGLIGFITWAPRLRVWNTETGEELCCAGQFLSGGQLSSPAFSLGSDWVIDTGPGITDPDNPTEPAGNGVRGYSINPDVPSLACAISPLYTCPNWAVALDGSTSTLPVLSDDGAIVYVGTDAGTVHAVDAASASVLWSVPVGSAVTAAPALAEGSLFVPTASGDLVVLNADTGATEWTASTGSSIGRQPAVANDVVFTGSADGSVHGFHASGCDADSCSPLWSASTGSEITGAPAINAGQLYVGTADGRLVAYGIPDS